MRPTPEPGRTEPRTASFERRTGETRIAATLTLDSTDPSDIVTGLGFLDHMLATLARHGRLRLDLHAEGDLHVDDHHLVEDCAITLGTLVAEIVGDGTGLRRFGAMYAPLDESLARAVIDCSGRPHASVELGCTRPMIGEVATENLTHFFISFAMSMRCTLHLDVIRGNNDHHRVEAAMKAFALALREATATDPGISDIPSTKGMLT